MKSTGILECKTGPPDESNLGGWLDRAKALARAAFDLRRPSGDLARLVHDSLVDADDSSTRHDLRFERDDLTMYVRVSVEEDHADLCGRLEPPDSWRAVLQASDPGPPLESAVATPGRFSFRAVRHGLVRMRVDTPDGPTVWTDWFRV